MFSFVNSCLFQVHYGEKISAMFESVYVGATKTNSGGLPPNQWKIDVLANDVSKSVPYFCNISRGNETIPSVQERNAKY